jgi:bacterioferritin
MKGNRSINSELNRVLGLELIAINQYFLHARILKNWGLSELAERRYAASIEAMREADRLIERVLFLEGLPNLQDLGKLTIGQTAPEILASDLTLETALRTATRDAVSLCEKESDYVSRELLGRIQKTSEERIDFLEVQHDLIASMGLQNYLQAAASSGE